MDKELLEKAAKAAGWTGWQSKHGYWNLTSPEGESSTHCHYWNAYCPDTGEKLRGPTFADAIADAGWNPLTDDGDALRLAAHLRMNTSMAGNIVSANQPFGDWLFANEEVVDGDRLAAIRRAIVRAAAEIGRGTHD